MRRRERAVLAPAPGHGPPDSLRAGPPRRRVDRVDRGHVAYGVRAAGQGLGLAAQHLGQMDELGLVSAWSLDVLCFRPAVDGHVEPAADLRREIVDDLEAAALAFDTERRRES